MKFEPSERVLIVAKTGSGKTEWVKYMLRHVEKKWPICIIDPNELWLGKGKGKKASEWALGKELGTVDKPRLVNSFDTKWHVQCIQAEDGVILEDFCRDVLRAEDRYVYFDETEGIATATYVPEYFRVLIKRGRAHKVGVWCATQTPTGIPKILKSQSEHRVVLKVGEEDEDIAASLVHVSPEEIHQLKRYEYYYYNPDMDNGEWHAPLAIGGV